MFKHPKMPSDGHSHDAKMAAKATVKFDVPQSKNAKQAAQRKQAQHRDWRTSRDHNN